MIRSPYLDRRPLRWSVGCHRTADEAPAGWAPARVPGGAQLDWGRANGLRDPHVGSGWRDYLGLEDRFWTYRTVLGPADVALAECQRLHLVCEGVDFECDVLLDGRTLHHQRGLHQPVDLDLTGQVRAGQVLDIRIHPAPKAPSETAWGERWAVDQRSQARHVTKPSVSYGDDFHPRLIPLGLWQDAYLDVRPAPHLVVASVDYRLDDDLGGAAIWIEGELSEAPPAGTSLRWLVAGPGNQVSVEVPATGPRFRLDVRLQRPALWWPHDHGHPDLHSSRLELLGTGGALVDVQESVFGLRRIRLVMHEGGWGIPDPDRYPKTRSNPPMTVEVNGRAIFAKGGTCVPMSIFYGTVTDRECDELVAAARGANLNLLRISGGGVAHKPAFYDACDREGMLVWQDFPLACNLHPDHDEYLQLLDRESRAMIARLRQHPSLALWCGGNELFEIHSGMTEQSLAVRLLNRNTFELDPRRPFLPSTPLMGVAHGPYEAVQDVDGELIDGFALTQRATCTAYPEFGCPGPAAVEVLRRVIPPDELFPPRPGTAWEDHGAFFAFDRRPDTWLGLETIERYLGSAGSLEELVEQGQLIQGECLKAIYEEARRQRPTCSIATVWSLNEPWPTAANLSLLSWPCVPKSGYYEVAAACRPVLASARATRLRWDPGEPFWADLWLLSDSPQALSGGRLEAWISGPWDSAELLAAWEFGPIGAQENRRGPTVSFDLPRVDPGVFVLSLRVQGHPDWDSRYRFALRPLAGRTPGRDGSS